MAKNSGPGITLTLRRLTSGHKLVALQGDDMNQMYSIARVLIRSPEYNACYAVAQDWQGNQVFNVQPEQVYQEPAPYQMPAAMPQQQYQPQPYPQQYGYALPPAPAPPQYHQPAPPAPDYGYQSQQLAPYYPPQR